MIEPFEEFFIKVMNKLKEPKVRIKSLFCLFLALMFISTGCRKKPAPSLTPLHWAALRGNREVVELLLAHGADVTAKDNTGRTPVDEAARRGHNNVVVLLRQRETKE